MIQTDYSPDKFGTYLSHPESLGGGIDLSEASVREIILAYRAYRRTLNPSFNNDHILRRVDKLEEEFSHDISKAGLPFRRMKSAISRTSTSQR